MRATPGPTGAPRQDEVERLLIRIHRRVLRALHRRGLLEGKVVDALAERQPVLAACYEGSTRLEALPDGRYAKSANR